MGDADAILSHGDKTVILDNESRGPRWSAEPTFGQTQTVRAIGDTGHHILNAMRTEANQMAAGHNLLLNNQGNIRSDVRDVGHNVSRDVTSGQREILGEICNVRDAVRQDGTSTRERIQSAERGLAKDICDTRDSIRVESGAIQREVFSTREAVRLEACQTREVVKDRTDALARDMLREFAQTRENDIRNFADIRLQASENTSRLSKELAECCCEVKELVRGEATATRELIQATENARLREGLADAKSEINQQGLANIIIQALNRGNGS